MHLDARFSLFETRLQSGWFRFGGGEDKGPEGGTTIQYIGGASYRTIRRAGRSGRAQRPQRSTKILTKSVLTGQAVSAA